jgi:hypothetical protein
MFDPPASSDIVNHEAAYVSPAPPPHSFDRSNSCTSPASQLAVRPAGSKDGVRDRRAIIALLKAYRLNEEAVHVLKQTQWEVRMSPQQLH